MVLITKEEILMSETCPTVAIKSDNDYGYIVINKSDLKEGDKVVGSAEESKPKAKAKSKAKTKSTDAE